MPATAELMQRAAGAFLAALSEEQRARMRFPLDADERLVWNYTPVPRRGVPLRALSAEALPLAHALISSGYSPAGAVKATTIMSLESVLDQFEALRRFERDPEGYYLTIFGEPAADAPWGWRLEGHHVSLNVTLAAGQIASTPAFFGANPAEVRQGPRAGLRVLAAEEDIARDLLCSLDAGQRARAVIDAKAPADLLSENRRRALHLGGAGLPADALRPAQHERLRTLLDEYAAAMPAEVAAARMAMVQATAPADLRFAWAGGAEPGDGHYYRIQSSTFLVEYDNTQDGANHVHSVWRDFDGDWGLDLLGRHLAASHARAAE